LWRKRSCFVVIEVAPTTATDSSGHHFGGGGGGGSVEHVDVRYYKVRKMKTEEDKFIRSNEDK
jgi:hypothetical protein